MRKLALTLALFALFGAAQARFFLGFPSGSIVAGGATVPMAGIHFGSYDAFGNVGGRVTLEASVLSDPDFGQLIEGGSTFSLVRVSALCCTRALAAVTRRSGRSARYLQAVLSVWISTRRAPSAFFSS